LKEELKTVEDEIEEAEQTLQQISADLQKATEDQSFDKIQSLSEAYASAESNLEKLLSRWEKMHGE
jgi:hypothetical protein